MNLGPDGQATVLNDRYQVLRPVGHGGMGAVYLVYDRQEEREVALKCFPPRARRVEDLAHFEHEFLTLSRLRHPNLACVYDFGVIEGTQDVFFTSEYIAGQDLAEVASKGLTEPALAALIVQVCRGLEYIHSRQIIHYDVKPSNILVTDGARGSGRVAKLIDFGLAAEQVDASLGVIKGTVSYLAPEVARHLPVDARADLYSLGVTVFHCVTGKLPFKGETNLDVVRKVVSDPVPDPRDLGAPVSDDLARLIMRLMAKDPGARFQRGNEVIRALAKLYGGSADPSGGAGAESESFAEEPRESALPFVMSGGCGGREEEFGRLCRAFDTIFSWRDPDDPLAGLPGPGAQAPRSSSDSAASGFVITSHGGLTLDLGSTQSRLDVTRSRSRAIQPREPSEQGPGAGDVAGEAEALPPAREGPPDLSGEQEGLDWLEGSGHGSGPSFAPLPAGGGLGGLSAWSSETSAHLPSAELSALPVPLPHLFLVTGEVGVGKSRLLRELKTYGQLRRVAVVEGRARVQGRAYDAFVQVFRGILGLWHKDADESAASEPLRPVQNDPLRRRLLHRYGTELVRLIPELDSSSLPLDPRPHLPAEQEELRLVDALAQFLIGYSRVRPLVVLLHDLEDADVQTFTLLSYLVRNLALVESTREVARRAGAPEPRPVRLLVVATCRESELAGEAGGDARGQVLAKLQGERVTQGLRLGPLSQEQVRSLLESMLGQGAELRDLPEKVYAESKGIPFFTEELMRRLVETGQLVREDGRWVARLEGGLELPERVADVIVERSRRVSDEERQPLELLAVLARPATVHELAVLSEKSPRELVPLLEDLERRQVLFSEPGDDGARRYEPIHDLARQAVYEAISPEERLGLHAACGAYLEKRSELGDGLVDLGELVWHFTASGERAKALEFGIRAADEARAVHATHRALELYGGALSLLPVGSSRWRDLLQRTGELLLRAGDYRQAVGVYDRLLGDELRETLRPAELVRAYRWRALVRERQGDYDGALEDLSLGAASAYPEDGLQREAAALLAATASIYLRTGRYQDAVGFCEAARARLVGVSEAGEAAEIAAVMGRSQLALGDTQAAEGELERCLRIYRREGDEVGLARTLADLGAVSLATGRPEEATERFERALEREQALGHVAGIAEAASRLARACRQLGQQERAVSLLRRALQLHEKTGARAEAVRVLIALGESTSAVGEYRRARDYLARARKESERLGLLAATSRTLDAQAALMLRLGDQAVAEELAREALRLASLQGDAPRERAAALEILARVAISREELDAGELLLTQAQALYRANNDAAGVVRSTLAMADVFLRRGDDALIEPVLGSLDAEAEREGGRPLGRLERARVQLLRARAASGAAVAERPSPALLGELERASAVAERFGDLELAWRIAAARGQLLVRLGEDESALASFVEAMTAIRDLAERVPSELRSRYVTDPDARRCQAEFAALRERLHGGAAR